MDALVAEKVMGFSGIKWYPLDTDWLAIGVRPEDAPTRADYRYWNSKAEYLDPVKPYSTSISAAWEVVEKLEELDFDPRIEFDRFGSKVLVTVILGCPTDDDLTGQAPTAPLAICRAALHTTIREKVNG